MDTGRTLTALVVNNPPAGAGIGGWEELGIVIAGTIIASAIVALAAYLWRRSGAPTIAISCGNSERFRSRRAPEERHRPPRAHAHQLTTVHVTRLLISETRNKRGARRVHLRVTRTDPMPESPQFPYGLQWLTGEDYYDLPPGGRGFIRLCEDVRDSHDTRANWFTSVPELGPGTVVAFSVQAYVDDKPNGKPQSLTADWTDANAYYPDVREGA